MATVTVALKLPHGYQMRVFNKTTRMEPVMGGGQKEVSWSVPVGEPVLLNGYGAPFGQAPKALVVGGYALTSGVDADLFARWMADNADSDMVKHKLIFAYAKENDAAAAARENEARTNGLEPLDPENPRPEFRRIQKAVPGVA